MGSRNFVAGFSTEVQGGVTVILYISVIPKVSELVTNMEAKDTSHHLIKT